MDGTIAAVGPFPAPQLAIDKGGGMTLLNKTLVASLVLASALTWVGCGGREGHQGGQPTATTIPGAPPPAQP